MRRLAATGIHWRRSSNPRVVAMIGWNAFLLLAAVNVAPPATPPTPEQVMAIPPELKQRVREEIVNPTNSLEQRLQRLVDLVFQPRNLDAKADPDTALQYDTAATLTVAEAWTQHRANCLSFTLLFVALAREAGIDARVQEVGQVVMWYQEQGVVYNAGHVNVGLRINGRHATLDLDQNVLYDRRGPRLISDQRALAHFYNNRGAELLAAQQMDAAREHFRMALEQEKRFAPVWNNLGVLERRSGNTAAAVHAFDNALALDPGLPSALSNASLLYQRIGEGDRAARLNAQLQRVREHDPFYQFMQGVEAERRADYPTAIHYYRHAIRLYGTAHQFHFGLARVYSLSGDNRRAAHELEQARTLGKTDRLRAIYQAKLDTLRKLNAGHAGH